MEQQLPPPTRKHPNSTSLSPACCLFFFFPFKTILCVCHAGLSLLCGCCGYRWIWGGSTRVHSVIFVSIRAEMAALVARSHQICSAHTKPNVLLIYCTIGRCFCDCASGLRNVSARVHLDPQMLPAPQCSNIPAEPCALRVHGGLAYHIRRLLICARDNAVLL
ncbi:hypothetical protein GQ54DRAFT_67759 [Martensiomyces pterosporus]|nr:hypothetical protein GQ54DRAFT_67759 [Martensiomyces pterosporus]